MTRMQGQKQEVSNVTSFLFDVKKTVKIINMIHIIIVITCNNTRIIITHVITIDVLRA